MWKGELDLLWHVSFHGSLDQAPTFAGSADQLSYKISILLL